MKTIILNILLIFNILLSPLTASKEVTDHLTQGILLTYEEISKISVRLSALRAYKTRVEQSYGKIVAQSEPFSQQVRQVTEKLFITQEYLYILLKEYKQITGTRFTHPFLIKHPPYIPRVQNLTLNSPVLSGVSGKFTTTSSGLPAPKKPTQEFSQSEIDDSSSKLCLNIKEEHKHLAELKALLRTPPYQDPASPQTQEVYNQIEECLQIIEGSNQYLIELMYPNRSIESLNKEAQQNCLGPVKLVLHEDGYFHIRKSFWSPDKPRKRPCTSLEQAPALDDFSSCGLSSTPSENLSFVSEPHE